uniref:Uncharacterized protein n=1 Tax=Aegilops tauschii subsp. strangulata TaxID=200361 RepID=A0A452ZMD6_AEGTS
MSFPDKECDAMQDLCACGDSRGKPGHQGPYANTCMSRQAKCPDDVTQQQQQQSRTRIQQRHQLMAPVVLDLCAWALLVPAGRSGGL